MNWILDEAKSLQDEIVCNRRYLHSHPETGVQLPETTAYVKSKLEEMGVEYNEICECGLVVLFGKKPGKCILLRADMDALPMQEESGLPFASVNDGCAHTCGHDMHMAMMLAVCKMLKAHEQEIQGQIKIMFQPGEEIFAGAAKMLDAGVLEDPKVDAAITLHVTCIGNYPEGVLAVAQPGPALASCDSYRIEVNGKGCHGAHPDQGIDPIATAAHILVALQQISARELDAGEPIILTQGSFHSGKAPNIIPSTAVIEGTLRTFNDERRKQILKRMEDIVTGVGKSFGADAKFVWLGGCAPLVNDPIVRSSAVRYIKDMLGEDALFEKPAGFNMSSEDFGNVTSRIPGIQLSLCVNSMADGAKYPPHNPKAIFHEDFMYRGTAAFVCCALRWLEDNK